MEIPLQNDIEQKLKSQFGRLLETAKSNCSPGQLTSKAKVAAFSRSLTEVATRLLDPTQWFRMPRTELRLGLARNLDLVAGYDRHWISFLLPPVPFPVILGPVPIPFINIISLKPAIGPQRRLAGRLRLNSRPVFINNRQALSGPQEVRSLIAHKGPLKAFPAVTVINGHRRPRCTVQPAANCRVFINGKKAIRLLDEGVDSCKRGRVVMVRASGNVKG